MFDYLKWRTTVQLSIEIASFCRVFLFVCSFHSLPKKNMSCLFCFVMPWLHHLSCEGVPDENHGNVWLQMQMWKHVAGMQWKSDWPLRTEVVLFPLRENSNHINTGGVTSSSYVPPILLVTWGSSTSCGFNGANWRAEQLYYTSSYDTIRIGY